MSDLLIRNLEIYGALSYEEKHALSNVIVRSKEIAADQDIVRDGDRPTECSVILEGLACRYKVLPSGKRQIMSFHIPGDICDLHGFLLTMDHNIGTLTPSRVGFIPHKTIEDLLERFPRIARALWRITLVDGAVFREWMAGMGRRTAHGQVAHLLCEVMCRYKAVGLTDNYSLELHLTQAELGDALGLSTVHVNRVLQELRGEGLITLSGGTLVINEWERLRELGEFDSSYLHHLHVGGLK